VRWNGLKAAARETRRQKASSASRAPARPPAAKPEASTAAFIAPAEVPEIASMSSQVSSSRRSSTPQVKAPWLPPPCSARSTSRGSRAPAAARGFLAMVTHAFAGDAGRVLGHRHPCWFPVLSVCTAQSRGSYPASAAEGNYNDMARGHLAAMARCR
jgi:hypothetical protein